MSRRGSLVVAAHLLVTMFAAWAAYVASCFPQASGLSVTAAKELSYAFQLGGTNVVTFAFLQPLPKLFVFLGLTLVPDILVRVFGKIGGDPSWFDEYWARAMLADLDGDLYPLHGRHQGNFNFAAAAPAIRSIRRRLQKLVSHYQAAEPGSFRAAAFLNSHWMGVRRQLAELVSEDQVRQAELQACTYLFTSTSRAIEACLCRLDRPNFVVSPYEHPSEIAVVETMSALSGTLEIVKPREEWLADPTKQVAAPIASAIISRLKSGANVVLLSDVACITGLRVPVAEIVGAIREAVKGQVDRDVVIVIDGAHAYGHVQELNVDLADIYVCSAHKWILSEYPAGIAFVNNSRLAPEGIYDVWGSGISRSAAHAEGLLGLQAALSWRQEIGPEAIRAIRERSELLRNRFVERALPELEVVGSRRPEALGRMIAIRPAGEGTWKPLDLRMTLADAGYSCEIFEVVTMGPERRWVRLSFPYFADSHALDRLVRTLKAQLR